MRSKTFVPPSQYGVLPVDHLDVDTSDAMDPVGRPDTVDGPWSEFAFHDDGWPIRLSAIVVFQPFLNAPLRKISKTPLADSPTKHLDIVLFRFIDGNHSDVACDLDDANPLAIRDLDDIAMPIVRLRRDDGEYFRAHVHNRRKCFRTMRAQFLRAEVSAGGMRLELTWAPEALR